MQKPEICGCRDYQTKTKQNLFFLEPFSSRIDFINYSRVMFLPYNESFAALLLLGLCWR